MILRLINSLMIATGVAPSASASSPTVSTPGNATDFGGPTGASRRIVDRAPVAPPPPGVPCGRRLRRRRYSTSPSLPPPPPPVVVPPRPKAPELLALIFFTTVPPSVSFKLQVGRLAGSSNLEPGTCQPATSIVPLVLRHALVGVLQQRRPVLVRQSLNSQSTYQR